MNRQLRLSQRDPRWYNVKLGKSVSVIGTNGCACTSLAMAVNKLNHAIQMTPDVLAKELSFVAVQGDSDPRYIDWNGSRGALGRYGVDFVWRDSYTAEDKKRLSELASSEKWAVILQVKTKTGGQHWVYLWKWGVFGPVCWDPWDGTCVYKLAGLFGKYKAITGYSTFKART